MKLLLLCLILLCLTGCGKREDKQVGHRVVYPPLTESPSPLLPSNANLSEDSVEEPEPQVVPEVVVLDGWMEKHLKKEELIKILREQRAKNPNDPFALSEETIDELSKIEDIAIQ